MGRERSDLRGPQPKALYTIQEWNHFKNTSPRTNNHAEGHNNALNHSLNKVIFWCFFKFQGNILIYLNFKVSKPDIFSLIKVLRFYEF